MVNRNDDEKHVITFDYETDPFSFGRVPKPFVIGIFDGSNFEYCWHETPE